MNDNELPESPEVRVNMNAESNGPATHQCTVLCVDDDHQLRQVVARVLRKAGFTVVEAATCAEAKRAMKTGAPMPMVLDVDLPDGNGFELASQWRVDQDRTAPILFISGRDAGECEAKAAQLQAAFLPKPFGMAALLANVKTLFQPSA